MWEGSAGTGKIGGTNAEATLLRRVTGSDTTAKIKTENIKGIRKETNTLHIKRRKYTRQGKIVQKPTHNCEVKGARGQHKTMQNIIHLFL